MTVPETLPSAPLLPASADPDALPAVMLAVADHHERLALLSGQLDNLTGRIAAAEDFIAATAEDGAAGHDHGYEPVPAPRWWMLTPDSRADATDRLAAWTQQVYRPSYGHLAATLPACWPRHDLCLYVLDFLAELHSVLYLAESRSVRALADQAEFHLRILPAAAQLMAVETARCDHSRQVS